LPRKSLVALVVTTLTAFAVPAVAAPEPVDFSTWIVHDQPYSGVGMSDPGNWVVDPTGLSVQQLVNGRPTFFASPDPVDGYRITATFQTPATDNDLFGVALGFTPTASEYLLIDWRQSFQDIDWGEGTGPVDGTEGLTVSRVTGVPTLNEFWAHTNSPANPAGGLVELARGADLGATGWVDDTSYDFVIEYTTSSLDVWVDGAHEISITGDFPSGPLALYNFSQPGMTMNGLTTEPLNSAPEVLGGGADDVSVDEGDHGFTSGAFVDGDADPLNISCAGSCAGFSDNGDGSWTWSQLLPEGPNGFSVTVTASDGLEETSDQFTVSVANLAPVITSTTSLGATHDMDTALNVDADFTDAGVHDTHTATFTWGDGTSSPGQIVEADGSGTASSSHMYVDPGTYIVSVTVEDDDGAQDSVTLGQIFVFDPDDFVTGGGLIDSPDSASPVGAGKATFGFVARYTRGGAVTGNLQFQLHKGLSFHATAMDFLFIDDGIAVFEGTGRLNGIGGYDFRVVATDERHASATRDLFWITIDGPSGLTYNGAALPGDGLPVRGKGIQVHDR
jgi:hypothetical protein